MKKEIENVKSIIENVESSIEIDEVIELLREVTGEKVFFDDSRMWTLGYRDDDTGTYYGAQRGYLGGGMRGAIRTNLSGDPAELFTAALLKIEEIYNSGYEEDPVWDRPTGVLL